MKKYKVTGMSCAACSARVEKAVSAVDGVSSCSVSLLTNSMGVEGNASDEQIIKAVVDRSRGRSGAQVRFGSDRRERARPSRIGVIGRGQAPNARGPRCPTGRAWLRGGSPSSRRPTAFPVCYESSPSFRLHLPRAPGGLSPVHGPGRRFLFRRGGCPWRRPGCRP